MATSIPLIRAGKGRVLLHDSLVFGILSCVAAVLFGITLLLFHTFEDHRNDLGRDFSAQGMAALRGGRPAEAVDDLRVALSYKPDDRGDQFALAQALAASGHNDEAMNYFLTLWTERPGEGITNLQLARLEREKGDAPAAINYYRASVFGSWEGDGVLRRREARLELADYFRQIGNGAGARQELLIAAGNAPPEEYLEVSLGDRLESIGDASDALQLYNKALQQDPHRRSALIKAGRAAYQLGDYTNAARLLGTALHEAPTSAAPASDDPELEELLATARRIPELNLSRELPATERADHLLAASGIARKRLQTCVDLAGAKPGGADDEQAAALHDLQARWKFALAGVTRRALDRDASAEDQVAKLVGDTEQETAVACGDPKGDDAVLLKLAGSSGKPQSTAAAIAGAKQ